MHSSACCGGDDGLELIPEEVGMDDSELEVGEPTGLGPLGRVEDRIELEVRVLEVRRRPCNRRGRLIQRARLVRRPWQRAQESWLPSALRGQVARVEQRCRNV